ncbi:unnamed protein product [Brassica oleracea]
MATTPKWIMVGGEGPESYNQNSSYQSKTSLMQLKTSTARKPDKTRPRTSSSKSSSTTLPLTISTLSSSHFLRGEDTIVLVFLDPSSNVFFLKRVST